MKKIMRLILVALTCFCFLGISNIGSKKVDAADAQLKAIYFKPGDWAGANAWFAIHAWDSATNKDYKLEKAPSVNGSTGLYYAMIKSSYTNVIVLRMDPDATEPSFDTGLWNKTANLTIPSGKNTLSINSGEWTGATGTWTSTKKKIVFYTSYIDGLDDGSTAMDTTISGDEFVVPADPVCSGYNFTGWYDSSSNKLNKNAGDTVQNVPYDMKYYAHWEKAVVKYDITFTCGSDTQTVAYAEGETPVAPEFEGYTYIQWPTFEEATEACTYTATGYIKSTVQVSAQLEFSYSTTESATTIDKDFIYFTDNYSWGTISCYMWKENGSKNAAWPGVLLKDPEINGKGEKVYKIAREDYQYVIFNNGNSEAEPAVASTKQTPNVELVSNSSGFYINGTTKITNEYGTEETRYTVGTWNHQVEGYEYTFNSMNAYYGVENLDGLTVNGLTVERYYVTLTAMVGNEEKTVTSNDIAADKTTFYVKHSVLDHEATDITAKVYVVVDGVSYEISSVTTSAKKLASNYVTQYATHEAVVEHKGALTEIRYK